MTPVFGHGRLRLYLLKLLADGPRHGYELIRLLEDRFLGLYAPSAGTIYPRLQRMETDGLITHTAAAGRKTYRITETGRAELRDRATELAALEADIRASVADLSGLARQVQSEVHGSVRDLKRELRAAAREVRRAGPARAPADSGAESGPVPGRADRGGDPAADLDDRLVEFVTEVRSLIRGRRFTDAQLATARRIVDGAAESLRRLLR
ncbi:PadR family transcriptional regulator [Plantactinospora sp. GCM10030261]|uniref:PadR family transcriptional regulator n=1 Tax=Plantactinospora sp. GCM10030261 TaxID=3273420 RepID=UPI00362300CA